MSKWSAGIVALAMAAVGCGVDGTPSAPEGSRPSTSHAAAAAPAGRAIGILRAAPLTADITVSAVIGPRGGTLQIPQTGLRVEIPAGAVAEPTTITATAIRGDMVAYEFGPHGTTFRVPLLVTQDTRGVKLGHASAAGVVEAGYFTGRDMLDHGTKTATLAEVLPTHVTKARGEIGFHVSHFSGYMIHWGVKKK